MIILAEKDLSFVTLFYYSLIPPTQLVIDEALGLREYPFTKLP